MKAIDCTVIVSGGKVLFTISGEWRVICLKPLNNNNEISTSCKQRWTCQFRDYELMKRCSEEVNIYFGDNK